MTSIKQVPLLDLQAQYAPIKEDVLKAIQDVFESKQFILGPKVDALESEISTYCQSNYALGVSSGTDALILALMGLGVGEGDEVITTPFTFFATVGSIVRCGAKPVFVDINPDTFLMNEDEIEAKITAKTKAIMPVHLFGQMCNMDKIMSLAKKHNLVVIEDAAQAIGSEYKGKRAGSIGDAGCFSFFPSKNLGACGDAGIITTQNEALYKKMHLLRVHGAENRYFHKTVGGNFRIDPMQAAVLSVKLPHLNAQHNGRQANAKKYNDALSKVVKTPTVLADNNMIYNQYSILTPEREALQAHLNERKVGCAIYYPLSLHLQECFSDLGYKEGDFPVSEKVSKEILALPVFAELTDDQVDFVIKNILDFF